MCTDDALLLKLYDDNEDDESNDDADGENGNDGNYDG